MMERNGVIFCLFPLRSEKAHVYCLVFMQKINERAHVLEVEASLFEILAL